MGYSFCQFPTNPLSDGRCGTTPVSTVLHYVQDIDFDILGLTLGVPLRYDVCPLVKRLPLGSLDRFRVVQKHAHSVFIASAGIG